MTPGIASSAGVGRAQPRLKWNLPSNGTARYTWNARNQLANLSGGPTASFAYDGIGRRRSKTIAGATTNFLYDGLNFVQEQSGGGTPTGNLLTGLGIDETWHGRPRPRGTRAATWSPALWTA
jgi:hypothetical protein